MIGEETDDRYKPAWSPTKIKRTTEEMATCDKASYEKFRVTFCTVYPELIGKEFKWEARIIESWKSYCEDLENKAHLVKLAKCKSPAKYVLDCPSIYNSKISCVGNDEFNSGEIGLCTLCHADVLMEDLIHRCKALTQDKTKNQGTF